MIQVMNSMKQRICTGLFCGMLLLAANVAAQDLDALNEGQAAFNAGDYGLSFSLWSALATRGNTSAQVFVGLSYDNGWGTQRSPRLARLWLHKAAQKNNASAQYLLGLHYIQGTRAERREGLIWLQRAANNHDQAAQRFLKKGRQRGWFKDILPASAPAEKKQPPLQSVALDDS